MENVAQETGKAISDAIKIDEKGIRDHLDGLVRQSDHRPIAFPGEFQMKTGEHF